MLLEILAAGAEAAAPQNKFGFNEMMFPNGNPNWIALTTAIILGIMFFGSLLIMFTRFYDQVVILGQNKALATFWRANSLREGLPKLGVDSPFRDIVEAGLNAEEQHGKLNDALEANEWLQSSLLRAENSVVAYLNRGLPFLATVGATAPFVGLFGTVIGIYRALIAIGIAGSASIDKVAGPVGEALIMTAIGLLTAVPAVLAYNYLQARNKRITELLSSFANDVLANINSKGTLKPARAAAPTKPAAATAKPATAAR